MLLNQARCAAGGTRLATAGLAVAIGAFGWLVAHTLNFWLIAHSHAGALSTSQRHVHDVTAAAAVVTGGLAAAALITAVFVGGVWPRPRRGTVPLAAGLSTVAFLTADTLEHTIFGLQSTPPIVIVFGALLHAAFGAGTSVYWLRLIDGICVLVLRPAPQPAFVSRPRPPSSEPVPWRLLLWADAVAGRAPPAC